MSPFLQKAMLARKERHVHAAPSLPNGSVAGPQAINGCGNGATRISGLQTNVEVAFHSGGGSRPVVAKKTLVVVLALERVVTRDSRECMAARALSQIREPGR